MNLEQTISELTSLPVVEKLRIIESVWDSISPSQIAAPTPEQQAEIDRRIAAHDADPTSAISSDELKRRLKTR
jgi:putative addiction module component (TIGR02574 family)